MRLSSLSAAFFAAFAWTAKAAEEGEIKSVSVRSCYGLGYSQASLTLCSCGRTLWSRLVAIYMHHGTRATWGIKLTERFVAVSGL